MSPLEPFIHTPRIAYFSMEIALREEIHTYSGGLGVLAGDTLRSGADLEVPLIGVTLISRFGYFRQEINAAGRQVEHPDPWQPEAWTVPLLARVAVPIAGRNVWVQAWLYVLKGGTGFEVPVILLDTDFDDNMALDREITHFLYGDGEDYRLKQEIVLGIGGVRILQALGFTIHTYHMNEGHSALLSLDLLWRFERNRHYVRENEPIYDLAKVRDLCLFTTHTPVQAGHDQFSYELVNQILGDYIDNKTLRSLAGEDKLNMTCLALNLSGYINGVAKRHAEVATHMFPGYSVHAVTNGVHPQMWTSAPFARLYDAHVPSWRHEPELLVRADQIPNSAIWAAHCEAKQTLINYLRSQSSVAFDPEIPIIGFARRMTSYKRPDLLFSDLSRLLKIAAGQPFQIVLAGKAHPHDEAGKALIELLHNHIRDLLGHIKIIFLPNYNLSMALTLIAGSDIWLNTPQRPREASGTSGMKGVFNGVLNLSVMDGWWIEGCIEGVTGWAIGSVATASTDEQDSQSLYELFEHTVLPLYYQNRDGWIQMMKGAISKNAYYFNSHRMMRRYATEAYIR